MQIKATPTGRANIKMLNNSKNNKDAEHSNSYTWLVGI